MTSITSARRTPGDWVICRTLLCMVTKEPGRNGVRVTLSLDPADVEMLDKLAELEGTSRSAEVRNFLAALRPSMRGVIQAMEAARLSRSALTVAAAQQGANDLERLMPKLAELQGAVLGALAQIEVTAISEQASIPWADDDDDAEGVAADEGGEGR